MARLGGAALLTLSLILGTGSISSARPSKADLDAAKAKLDQLNRSLDQLVEQYDQARIRLIRHPRLRREFAGCLAR